jgi:heptosyltransferase-2
MDAITPDDVFAGIERSLNGQKAVFLDRDGVIIKDAHYLNRFEDLHIFSGVAQALSRLKEAGFKLICITNQSGIARGIVDESFVRQCHAYLIEKLGIDAFYYCPHHPDQGCACRKPEKALLKKAKAQHQIDLRKSFMIGDKDSDLLLAKGTPMKGVLAQTGKEKHSPYADFAAATLGEAVDWILKQESV